MTDIVLAPNIDTDLDCLLTSTRAFWQQAMDHVSCS